LAEFNDLAGRPVEHILNVLCQTLQMLPQHCFVELRRHKHVRPEGMPSHNNRLVKLGTHCLYQLADGVLFEFAHRRNVGIHATRQSRISQPEDHGIQVPQDYISIT
jgi:hypothetical protein